MKILDALLPFQREYSRAGKHLEKAAREIYGIEWFLCEERLNKVGLSRKRKDGKGVTEKSKFMSDQGKVNKE